MTSDYIWVFAFDKVTNKRREFIRCHKNNAKFYTGLYEDKGYNVKLFTSEELDNMIETEEVLL